MKRCQLSEAQIIKIIASKESGVSVSEICREHGIGRNSWRVDNKILEPVFKGEHDIFPPFSAKSAGIVPKKWLGRFNIGRISGTLSKGMFAM